MPADRTLELPLGMNGLDLRHSLTELEPGDLSDTLNWQLDRTGALTKRRGYQTFGVALPANILILALLQTSGGTNYILAHCSDGHVYSTVDGNSWTSIDSGISTSVPIGYAQYLDKIYYGDGTNSLRSWDGTTLTTTASAPKGALLTVWRNRLWIASARTVYWSAIGAPLDFTTNPLNTVTIPDDSNITEMLVGPNLSLGASGSDGVLVFTNNRIHRIYDDTDNATGVLIGGANVLVSSEFGAVGPNVTALTQEGTYVVLSRNGFYSTEGHNTTPESTRVDPLLSQMAWGSVANFFAFSLNGRYYLSYTPTGLGHNARLLEFYADLFRIGWVRRRGGQHQWMAHDIPIGSAVVAQTGTGEICYFADSSIGNQQYVRQLFVGGYDASGLTGKNDISAKARTGAMLFGLTTQKRLRRAELYGQGTVTMSVSTDLQAGAGEAGVFDMTVVGRVWDPADQWGTGVWGGGGGAQRKAAYYSARGRYLTFEFAEASQKVTTSDRVLGYAGSESGGAAVYSVVLKITPLDAD